MSSAARPRLVVATRSAHKLRELRQLLHPANSELVSLDELGVTDEVEETASTFVGNARLKARAYTRLTGLPVLADDSGLEVDALGGGPGVQTRRYSGEGATDVKNNEKLLGALAGLSPAERGARYVCVLVLGLPDGRGGVAFIATRGTLRGRIATRPKGLGGFGYDPIFEPQGERAGGRTLGEWSAEEKNRVSHRGRAAARMARRLEAIGF